jgi:CheY-like chemotaxis protein
MSLSELPREPWYFGFHDLMPFRVREILLVSSPYDAFVLEEDGRLTERLFVQYSELNLTAAPRITHAPTGAKAMELLASRRFDLVITMVRLDDVDVRAFGRRVKELHPALPVALLAFHEADLLNLPKSLGKDALDVRWVDKNSKIGRASCRERV